MKRRLSIATLAACLLTPGLWTPTGAEEAPALLSPSFRVSGRSAIGDEHNPEVEYSPASGEYLVVWDDARHVKTWGSDVFAQRVEGGGGRVGWNLRVSRHVAATDERDPALAYDSEVGEFLVVWEDWRDGATRGSDLFGQWISVGGTRSGPNMRLSRRDDLSENDHDPALAFNSTDGEFLLVWTGHWDMYEDPEQYEIMQLKIVAGVAVGEFALSFPSRPSLHVGVSKSDPAAAYNPDRHEYLVVWADERNLDTRGRDIFARRWAWCGTLMGPVFRVSGPEATSGELEPAVVYNPDAREYLVVWEDRRNTASRGSDIYAQRIALPEERWEPGIRVGANFRVSGRNAVRSEYRPAVGYSADSGEYLVVWSDRRNHSTRGWDVYGQKVSAAGSRAGFNFRVSGPRAAGDDSNPALAYNPNAGEYLVVWEDGRVEATRGTDIWGRRLSP